MYWRGGIPGESRVPPLLRGQREGKEPAEKRFSEVRGWGRGQPEARAETRREDFRKVRSATVSSHAEIESSENGVTITAFFNNELIRNLDSRGHGAFV